MTVAVPRGTGTEPGLQAGPHSLLPSARHGQLTADARPGAERPPYPFPPATARARRTDTFGTFGTFGTPGRRLCGRPRRVAWEAGRRTFYNARRRDEPLRMTGRIRPPLSFPGGVH